MEKGNSRYRDSAKNIKTIKAMIIVAAIMGSVGRFSIGQNVRRPNGRDEQVENC